jgi:hypothetical protein
MTPAFNHFPIARRTLARYHPAAYPPPGYLPEFPMGYRIAGPPVRVFADAHVDDVPAPNVHAFFPLPFKGLMSRFPGLNPYEKPPDF